MPSSEDEVQAQKVANKSALGHYDTFREHRDHLSALVCRSAELGSTKRLCVLGAGNCYDLDLEALARHYLEIHLVDLDDAALDRAWERQSEGTRARIVRHAPVDVSGALDRLERWARGETSVEELMRFAGESAQRLSERLPGPFDTVLSACLLTQIQLEALHVLGDSHPLFEAVRHTLALTHLRCLASLTAPRGRALLATDVSSTSIFPFKSLMKGPRSAKVLEQLTRAGHIFYVANPEWLATMARDDPSLKKLVRATPPLDVWSWQNGPRDTFLVYAMALEPVGT